MSRFETGTRPGDTIVRRWAPPSIFSLATIPRIEEESMNPRKRDEGMLVTPIGEKTVVYDVERLRAHSLARWAIAVVLLVGVLPAGAAAQVFLASHPDPGFTVGPLYLSASVTPELG